MDLEGYYNSFTKNDINTTEELYWAIDNPTKYRTNEIYKYLVNMKEVSGAIGRTSLKSPRVSSRGVSTRVAHDFQPSEKLVRSPVEVRPIESPSVRARQQPPVKGLTGFQSRPMPRKSTRSVKSTLKLPRNLSKTTATRTNIQHHIEEYAQKIDASGQQI